MLLVCAALALSACSWFDSASSKRDTKEISDTYYQLGVRYLDMNKIEEAKSNLLRSIDEDSDNVLARNALAVLYEKLGKSDEAEDQYEAAYGIDPEDVGTLNNLGRYWCEHDRIEKGLALLLKASDNPMNDRQWLALTNVGRCQLAQGKQAEAERSFRRALEANGNYAPALAAMQKISYQKGELWPAKAYLARYLSVAAHTPETLFIAYYTERTLGHQDAANEYRTQLLDKFPNSAEAKKIGSAGK